MTSIQNTILRKAAALKRFSGASVYRPVRKDNSACRKADVALLASQELTIKSAPWYINIIKAARAGDVYAATILQVLEGRDIFERPEELGSVISVGSQTIIAGVRLTEKLQALFDLNEAKQKRRCNWQEGRGGVLGGDNIAAIRKVLSVIERFSSFSVRLPKFDECLSIADALKHEMDFDWFRCELPNNPVWFYALRADTTHDEKRTKAVNNGQEGLALIVSR